MSEEVTINKIEWVGLEYNHREHSTDWYWSIGLITLIAFGITVWFKNYVFGIFILISGASLALFALRHPPEVTFIIETEGLTMGKDKYEWKNIKGFDVKKGKDFSKLLIETKKYFLPVYTIPIPNELVDEIKESLNKVTSRLELNESPSMLFMEKLGF